MLETLAQDLRYAIRAMRRAPGFTAIAVTTLALGIGANSAIFSVVDTVLLRPLPYPDGDRLVFVWNRWSGLGLDQASSSPPDYVDRREQNRAFSDIAATWQTSVTLTGESGAERLQAAHATASLFSVLQTPPKLGRAFSPEEDQPGAGRVAVISDDLWKRRFGGDPGVLGRRMVLDGHPVTVVGVMPAEFAVPDKVDLWLPAAFTPEQLSDEARGNEWLITVARLKPGVTIEAAEADMQRIAQTLPERFPEYRDYLMESGWGAKVVGMREQGAAPVRQSLLLLLGAVGFLLLIACANVANLLLVRAMRRHKEMAVRTALGAGHMRIVRQLLTEGLVLALLGGALGLLLTYGLMPLLLAAHPQGILGVDSLPLDVRVLGFTLGLSIVTGFLFSMAPAQGVRAAGLAVMLRMGGMTSSIGSSGGKVRGALVVAEVALTLMLLVGAGLMLRSFSNLLHVDPGFRTEQVITFRTSLPASDYEEQGRVTAFYDALREQLQALPGVAAVGFTSKVPLTPGTTTKSFQVEGREPTTGQTEILAAYSIVSADYFQAMGIPLISGRALQETDRASAPPVAVVDRQLARRLWPMEEDPAGRRIRIGGGNAPWTTVVGVVADVRGETLRQAGTGGMIYTTYTQDVSRDLAVVVHATADPVSVVAMVREAVRALDHNLPIFSVAPIDQVVLSSLAMPKLRTRLIGLFSILALILAGAGIYGVVAYTVSQRTQEIGVRIALGAKPGAVLRMVVAGALRLVLVGIALGTLGAFLATRWIGSLLFEVGTTDPATFIGVVLVLTSVALLASVVPARRAARVDPIEVLRTE